MSEPALQDGHEGVRSGRALWCGSLLILVAAILLTIAPVAAAGAAAPQAALSVSPPDLLAAVALQQAELTAATPAAYDCLGCSVAISGDTALVGAYQTTVNGNSRAGAAYVFTRAGASWTQQAELTASDAAASDWLGYAVALSGDTALAGAYGKTVGGHTFAGAAYVFTRSGASWTQQAELVDPSPVYGAEFGASVALSGDSALIGVPWKDGAHARAGTAYIFTRAGTSWSQQAELLRSDAGDWDYFGHSVAISGDTALVGAYGKTINGNSFTGAAYVYTRSGTTWSQQTELTAADGADGDALGSAVALSGDTALVAAHGRSTFAGAAYVFTRSGTTWSQQAELTASDPAANDEFGCSVALSGDSAAIGAWKKTVGGQTSAGASYVFGRQGTTWSQQAELSDPSAAAQDQFGCSVAISGTTLLSGADQQTVGGQPLAGAAYVELLDGVAPTTTATGLQASAGAAWQKTPAQVGLSATDNAGGSGVAATYYTIDGGAKQTYTAPFALADGAHTVTYWSVDVAGNVEAAHSGYANVDTKAPTAAAKKMTLTVAKAKKGKTLKFNLTIADPVPSCGTAACTLIITTAKGKKLAGLRIIGQPTDKALVISYKLRTTLKKGTYAIVVSATDVAGNVQAKATRAKLKVL